MTYNGLIMGWTKDNEEPLTYYKHLIKKTKFKNDVNLDIFYFNDMLLASRIKKIYTDEYKETFTIEKEKTFKNIKTDFSKNIYFKELLKTQAIFSNDYDIIELSEYIKILNDDPNYKYDFIIISLGFLFHLYSIAKYQNPMIIFDELIRLLLNNNGMFYFPFVLEDKYNKYIKNNIKKFSELKYSNLISSKNDSHNFKTYFKEYNYIE